MIFNTRLWMVTVLALLSVPLSGSEESRETLEKESRLSREEAVAALNGVVVPLITPVNEDLSLDGEGMRALVDYLIGQGVHGLFPCSLTGRYKLFDREERRQLIATVVEAAAGRVPVFAGVDDETPELTIAQAKWAAGAGVDGVLVIPPGQGQSVRSRREWRALREKLPAWQGEVLEFYQQLHDAVDLFVIVHDRGGRGLEVQPETYAKLAEMPRVIGLKKSSTNVAPFPEIRQAIGERLALSCGNEYVYLGALSMGCSGGVVGGGANVYPQLMLRLRERFLAGDLQGAFDYQTKINQAARRFREVEGAKSLALQALGIPVKSFSRRDPAEEWRGSAKPATATELEKLQTYVRAIYKENSRQ